MEQKDNLIGVLKTIFKWKKKIFLICSIAAVGSIIISLFLPNYYQSVTTFYAASTDQTKPGMIFGTSGTDMEYYGNDSDNDRLLTIAESNELSTYMIQKFGLYKHYDVDSLSEKAAYEVSLKFAKLYNATKTDRDAIEISVEDIDKEKATRMVNAARIKIDEMAQYLVAESQKKIIAVFEKDITENKNKLTKINDSLELTRNIFGIYNPETQSETMSSLLVSAESKKVRKSAAIEVLKANPNIDRDTITMLQADVKGYQQEIIQLKEQLVNFNKGFNLVENLGRDQKETSKALIFKKQKYDRIKAAFEAKVSAIHLIEEGTIPTIKSRPKRSIIVLASVMFAFIFSIIGILFIENYKETDWKAIWNG